VRPKGSTPTPGPCWHPTNNAKAIIGDHVVGRIIVRLLSDNS